MPGRVVLGAPQAAPCCRGRGTLAQGCTARSHQQRFSPLVLRTRADQGGSPHAPNPDLGQNCSSERSWPGGRDRRGRRPGCARLEGRRGAVLAVPMPCRCRAAAPAGTRPAAAHPGVLTAGPDPVVRRCSVLGCNLRPPGKRPRVRQPPWGQRVPAGGVTIGGRAPQHPATPRQAEPGQAQGGRASGDARREGAKRRCRARAGEEGIADFRARRDRCCCAGAALP